MPRRQSSRLNGYGKDHMTSHMTSTKNSHGFPMAILKDCRLPLRSWGMLPSPGGGGGKLLSLGGPRRAPAKLPVSVSLPPLCPGLAFPFSLSFFRRSLLPEALLPVRTSVSTIYILTYKGTTQIKYLLLRNKKRAMHILGNNQTILIIITFQISRFKRLSK